MEFGFTSWFSRAVSLTRAFRYISSAGCTGAEVAAMPAYLSRGRRIAESARASELEVTAVGLGVPFLRDPRLSLHSRDGSVRRESVRYVSRSMDLASGLGAPIVYVCSVRKEQRASRKEALESFRDSLRACAEYAEKVGVILAIEQFPLGEVRTFEAASSLVSEIDSKSFGVLLDTGHLAISGEAIDEAVVRSKRILKHVHVNNNDGLSDLHWPPQRGKLTRDDFRSFFLRLSESGYEGRASVELVNPRPIARTLADSVSYLREIIS
ncbi:MAG: sugar phosphate isomerase/epimerase [Thaumarchaeota archaeon]|nr:sugar phosphate isomerase/epimerase [Nitrososphaerota archaeon]